MSAEEKREVVRENRRKRACTSEGAGDYVRDRERENDREREWEW